MKKAVVMMLAVFTLVCGTDLMAKGKPQATKVSSIVSVEGKGKKAKVKFNDAEGQEIVVKGATVDKALMEAVAAAAEAGEAVEVEYLAGAKGAALVSVNGVKATKAAKGKKTKKAAKGKKTKKDAEEE